MMLIFLKKVGFEVTFNAKRKKPHAAVKRLSVVIWREVDMRKNVVAAGPLEPLQLTQSCHLT